MAILLIEKGKGEVVTAPVIRSEIGGGRVQISGRMSNHRGQRRRAAAARRLAGRADGDHRGTDHRPVAGRREHPEGLPLDAVGLRRDRGVHDRLLPDVRSDLGDRALRQPDVPDRPAVAAAGNADAAGHRRHRAGARHGHRLQRADQRAGARGTAQRRQSAGGDHRRLRARLGDHSSTPTSPP